MGKRNDTDLEWTRQLIADWDYYTRHGYMALSGRRDADAMDIILVQYGSMLIRVFPTILHT